MTDEAEQTTSPHDETRELLVVYAGPHALGVLALDADGAVPLARPAPLPYAPPAVLGVVAARGRMRTVIDPLPLLTHAPARTQAPADAHDAQPQDKAQGDAHDLAPRHALLLKGDEQLALAVSRLGPTVSVNLDELLPADSAHEFARGTLPHEGSRLIVVDPARLFDAATRGMERRRRRR
jgi:chemotaxis signal transduction protein